MALIKTINEKTVYVRIDRAIVGKAVQIPDLLVGIYEMAEDGALQPQTTMHFAFKKTHPGYQLFTPESLSVDGMNPIKAAYEFLKTLPQFGDFEDA